MEEEEISAAEHTTASSKTEETREIEKEKIASNLLIFAKLAAVFVPLLMLIVFGKLYVQIEQPTQGYKTGNRCSKEHTINEENKVIALADGTKEDSARVDFLILLFQGSRRTQGFPVGRGILRHQA